MTARRGDGRRGQLVLLAAATLVVAFVPMVLAYLQLGYHEDVGVAGGGETPIRNAERTLDRAVHEAIEGVPDSYAWANRRTAITAVRDRLQADLATLNRSAVATGTAYGVGYNASRATAWTRARCPAGPDRQFGVCRADRGVAVQNRAGRTHVLAVAFDLRVTTPGGDWQATVVVRTGR